MVDVTERQLRAWERQGLVPPGDSFGFSGLLALKPLKRLRELNIRPLQIRLAMEALKNRLENIDYPLAQLRITAEGRKITVHLAGSRMDPPVSEPRAPGASPAATATPEPDDEPPAMRGSAASHGLRAWP